MSFSETLHKQVDFTQEIFISAGAFPGYGTHFFTAYTSEADTSDPRTIWELNLDYVYSTSATSWYLSSTSAADTSTQFAVEYLDGDYERKLASVTPTGQTQTLVATDCFRILKVTNTSAVESDGDIYIAEASATSGGVPDDLSSIRSFIEEGQEVSHVGVLTVPAGESWYLRGGSVYVGTGAGAMNACSITLSTRQPLGVFIKQVPFEVPSGTVTVPETIPLKIEEKTDIQYTGRAKKMETAVSLTTSFITVRNERLVGV